MCGANSNGIVIMMPQHDCVHARDEQTNATACAVNKTTVKGTYANILDSGISSVYSWRMSDPAKMWTCLCSFNVDDYIYGLQWIENIYGSQIDEFNVNFFIFWQTIEGA